MNWKQEENEGRKEKNNTRNLEINNPTHFTKIFRAFTNSMKLSVERIHLENILPISHIVDGEIFIKL